MKLSHYHVVTQPFFDELEQQTKRVIFSSRTSDVRIIDEHSWHILASGDFDQLPQDILFDLVDIELIVPEEDKEQKNK